MANQNSANMVPKWLLNKYIMDDNKEASRNHAKKMALRFPSPTPLSLSLFLYPFVYTIFNLYSKLKTVRPHNEDVFGILQLLYDLLTK